MKFGVAAVILVVVAILGQSADAGVTIGGSATGSNGGGGTGVGAGIGIGGDAQGQNGNGGNGANVELSGGNAPVGVGR